MQRGGRVEIIANDQGHRITPSWVAFTDEERLYVFPFSSVTFPPRAYPETRIGDSAKNAFHSNPTNTVFDAKRLIGRKIEEPELQRDIKHWWVHFFLVLSVSVLFTFDVVGHSKSPIRVANPVYRSNIAAKNAIL